MSLQTWRPYSTRMQLTPVPAEPSDTATLAEGAPTNGNGQLALGPYQPDLSSFSARRDDDPVAYVPSAGLQAAVDVAITLGQPLLLTGDPGTGKTQLAYSVAYRLFNGAKPLVFNTKTTSAARDLFYTYDAVSHFRDIQGLRDVKPDSSARDGIDTRDYITYQALGAAILRAAPRDVPELPPAYRDTPQTQSVVLIDEIDKAPRDLPNDLLDEIEQMRFEVREIRATFQAPTHLRPIIIMTSNSEKLLPDPFLRRCVFYHLAPPTKADLRAIITRRLGFDFERPDATRKWIADAVDQFDAIRGKVKRKPSTAELLAYIRILERQQQASGVDNPLEAPEAKAALTTVAKNKEDLKTLTGER